MRGRTPTLHCDAEDGFCGSWEVDHYGCSASAVDGVRLSETVRAPGWVSDRLYDYCPEHAPEAARPSNVEGVGRACGAGR